tara:strand:- start:353 stop:541 length:189 start_codon:yes stop_codon:yes gene_type:complete
MSVPDYLEPAVKDFADQAAAAFQPDIDTTHNLLVDNLLLVKIHYKHRLLVWLNKVLVLTHHF